MSMYSADKIRNVCVLGHGGDGKTSLVESILYLTGCTDRLGKVSDGNTVCDYDPEEIKRQISISATLAPVERNGYKLNFIDAPGYFDFEGEVLEGIRVSDVGLITLTAKGGGIGVGTEKSWKRILDAALPRMIYVSKLDEEHADFYGVFEALRNSFGTSICPVVIPIIVGETVNGVVNLVENKAYEFSGGKVVEIPIPASMEGRVEEMYAILTECVAETSEELMEKYFSEEPFTPEEFAKGLKEGIINLSLAPVFCGSAVTGLGTMTLVDSIISYGPSPADAKPESATDASGNAVKVSMSVSEPACALVFKTISDQFGRFSFFKVVSGKITADMTLQNSRSGASEKMGHIYIVRGKKNIEIDEIGCGDIGAVSKLGDTQTGDTLCGGSRVVTLKGIDFPKPCYSQCIFPKVRGNEEKIANGLTRLHDEDPVFINGINIETHQHIISGMGDIHLDVLCSKLKNKFGVEVDLEPARVAYREKIRKKVKVQGKHKKQSGGHGQFGDVWVEFEPIDESEGFIFEEKIFGGSVPKNFHPAVEKGLRESIVKGVLAGYPVVGLKATLVDGSYHDVDSSEMAFKLAAALAYKAGLPLANPVLLEPIGLLKVFVPDSYMGDVIGDLNKRRGRVMGMNPTEVGQQIDAEVPMAEMSSYAIDLRSMTQGRGSFELNFERYEETPANIQQKVIEETKLREEEA